MPSSKGLILSYLIAFFKCPNLYKMGEFLCKENKNLLKEDLKKF